MLLDGFDLGGGVLFALNRNEAHRRQMMGAIAPVWDGNETWLVIIGTVLFGAFPVVYAIFLSAFYPARCRCRHRIPDEPILPCTSDRPEATSASPPADPLRSWDVDSRKSP
ncbi:cytochrome d ubiquinol oxidase subunit II [Thiocapsa rosea]|uniref:Bd-type cytochrome oxidase subunit II n=1 Tax=Thiocapsa rosea TaxID=69360 RepID=A0A495VER0_9GAMM|nr:cytochrome d ubiquinol oxidase subunit II [Thiocapsa rosea]RKT47320.1 bd-type cytochrome oxidase subunit II [Thiocapsa rosea]